MTFWHSVCYACFALLGQKHSPSQQILHMPTSTLLYSASSISQDLLSRNTYFVHEMSNVSANQYIYIQSAIKKLGTTWAGSSNSSHKPMMIIGSWTACRVPKWCCHNIFFFCILALWIPCIGGAWWKTSTAQIWWKSVHGGPRYGRLNM